MRLSALCWGFFLCCLTAPALAQGWGSIEGRVVEAGVNEPVPGVTILVDRTNFGTITDADGRYTLSIPEGSYLLRFTAVGYDAVADSVSVRRGRTTTLDVRMREAVLDIEGVTVEETRSAAEAGVHELSPEDIQNIPGPFHNGFGALMVTPGVATNNELSNQYSVRGGGFNENLIFLNGFEVFMPFRPRQGEQEGLGLLNPDLARNITFYTGGFPARYGGKLSSALDVRYVRPDGQAVRGSAYGSLLDAGFTAGSSAFGGRLGWAAGVRKAQARRFFGTQELKGNYQPDYTDVQGVLSLRIAPGHELEALGIWAEHEFTLDPRSRKTYFGTLSLVGESDIRSLWVAYTDSSIQRDGYGTRFGGVRLANRLSKQLRVEHDVAQFETSETEYLNLSGRSILYQVDVGSGSPTTGEGHLPMGSAIQEDRADNRVDVRTLTGQGRWILNAGRHATEAGYLLRGLRFEDRIRESGAVTGQNLQGEVERVVVDSVRDGATLDEVQGALYLQNSVDLLPRRDQLVLTTGLRADYFSFNDEWTFSPRLAARYVLSERTVLLGSAGVYYQAPTYRELRGEPDTTIALALNRDIKSQRSIQLVGGAEYFLPRRRLYLRAEAYWKGLTDVISYDIENVRVRYSGRNDASGHVYGLDTQVRGEIVPGLESWINYSFMVAEERLQRDPSWDDREWQFRQGLRSRPTDQRHTFSAYVQDYVPGDQTWKIHLRALFGSGLPYTPPVPGQSLGGVSIQEPGPRHSARYIEYKRMDAGITKELVVFDKGLTRPVKLELTAEILNMFDMVNTVAYTWVPAQNGIWNRIPTRLTPRTINVRMRIDF